MISASVSELTTSSRIAQCILAFHVGIGGKCISAHHRVAFIQFVRPGQADCIETQALDFLHDTLQRSQIETGRPRNPGLSGRTNSPHSDAPLTIAVHYVGSGPYAAGALAGLRAALAARTNATTARTIVISSCFNRIKLSALSRNSLMRNFSYPKSGTHCCTPTLRSVNVNSFPLAVPHCSSLNRHHYHDPSGLRKNLRFAPVWEGHEFHSCRNCREINSGFQPLRGMLHREILFPQPTGDASDPAAAIREGPRISAVNSV